MTVMAVLVVVGIIVVLLPVAHFGFCLDGSKMFVGLTKMVPEMECDEMGDV